MSKKKFKKFSKAEILAELGKINPEHKLVVKGEQAEAVKPRERVGRTETAQEEIIPFKNLNEKNAVPDFSASAKADLKKIGLLFGGMVVVLVLIDVISMKTNLVNNLGDFLFKIFHLY